MPGKACVINLNRKINTHRWDRFHHDCCIVLMVIFLNNQGKCTSVVLVKGLVSYSITMGTGNVLWELCTLHVPMFLICFCDLDNPRRGHWRPRHGDWKLHRPWVPYWLRVQGKSACKEKKAPYFIKLKKIYLKI